MTPRARSRLISIALVVLGLSAATALGLYGLSSRITYFHSPSEIISGELPAQLMTRPVRLGGMVRQGTLTQAGTIHNFTVTDYAADLPVTYTGILPTLFREGQGIVATGTYDAATGVFTATTILAKHDEKYMPPDVQKIMDRAGTQ